MQLPCAQGKGSDNLLATIPCRTASLQVLNSIHVGIFVIYILSYRNFCVGSK